jgi:NADH-quinone oxidoreductase subunit L
MTDTITSCLILIPALPLAAAVVCAVLGPKLLRGYSHWPVVLAFLGSFLASLVLLREVAVNQTDGVPGGFEQVVALWTWADVPDAYSLAASSPQTAADAGPRSFRVEIALRADALTAVMLAMVTFVSLLVALYSAGYMAGDRGYWRFFAYIGLFVFSMTMLVSVSNFVLLFVFWEAVGVCSYLLIGFWYHKPEAAAAGKKAFLVNRVGDFAFTLAMFLIWCTYGTLNYHDTRPDGSPVTVGAVANMPNEGATAGLSSGGVNAEPAGLSIIRGVLGQSRLVAGDYVTGGVATAICLLLLLGACGKSAQFPLHVWLPDAMEGPTPVSALIHAATMVTAGVYMVARCTPLFAASPTAQLVVAVVGGFTALLAALIALTQFDLKRVLAYSTISQLGYMFLALGAGTFAGVTSGMYHLFTHAFFKALLFLGAGSVMHAMGGVIDMRQFGGLKRLMPYTYWTFLVGCLALSGVFPFAGFWSKDAVLGSVHDKIHAIDHELAHRAQGEGAGHSPSGSAAPTAAHQDGTQGVPAPYGDWSDGQLQSSRTVYQWLFYGGLVTAFLTAFYTFRALALTFFGPERIPQEAGHRAHESPPVMTAPLVVLAVCSALVGVAAIALADPMNWGTNAVAEYLGHTPSLAAGAVAATRAGPEFHLNVAGLSTVAALAGIALSLFLYLGDTREVEAMQRALDLSGIERATDPQWVTRLERIWWIGWTTRRLRSWGLGFLVTTAALVLGLVALVLSVPLVIFMFLTPYRLSRDKFYFDELYAALVVWPLKVLASVCYWFDRWIIDGLVNAVGRLPAVMGDVMRGLQMGLVQFYALAMVLGMLILVAARLIWAA